MDTCTCPVCHEEMEIAEFATHIAALHADFLTIWAAMMLPFAQPESIAEWVAEQATGAPSWEDDLGVEPSDLSYEELLAICESIGYHQPGVENIDQVAPCTTIHTVQDTCPICLESMEDTRMRKITTCGHHFCADCLETWLSISKVCPVCKQDVTASPQMASISSSSSSTDAEASASSSEPTNTT
jgi:hypothetical protein